MPHGRRSLLRWVLVLCALGSLSALGQIWEDNLTDHIKVVPADRMLSLDWSDADDVLKGGITPAPLVAREPFTVSVRIEPKMGKGHDMPVVLTLRQVGHEQGVSQVVKREHGVWVAHFTPQHQGPHLLDVAFRTGQPKVLHAGLTVRSAPVPAWAWAAMLAVFLGLAAWVWRRRRQEVQTQPETAQ
jgi:hypothetical protein